MNRLKAILASLLFLILLTLAGLAWWWIEPEETTPVRKQSTSSSPVYPGVSIQTLTEETETYRTSIQIPVVADEQMNETISDYIKKKEEAFHDKRQKQPLRNLLERPAAFSVSFDIYPVGHSLYSFVLEVDRFTGTKQPLEKRAFLMDLGKGRLVEPSILFEKGAYEKVKEIGKVEEMDSPFTNVYLTEKEIKFLKEDREEQSLPYYDVSDLLKEKWRSVVDTSKPEIEKTQNESGDPSPVEEAIRKNPEGKQVALTFDDGPHPEYTPEILDLLEEYNETATFFLLGSRVDFYPDIVREISRKGHEIGNHTWSHKDLTTLTEEAIAKEISDTGKRIEEVTGKRPDYFRPPYGAEDAKVRRAAGLPSILWTLDTKDWKLNSAKVIASRVRETITDGAVILMHDIQKTSPEALEAILIFLEKEGYDTVPVSEMYRLVEE